MLTKFAITPLNACLVAESLVEQAGFVRVHASQRSEATYWRLPGRHGVVRVATHKKRSKRGPDGPTVACITFQGQGTEADGSLRLAPHALEFVVAQSIGLYMIRAPRKEEA